MMVLTNDMFVAAIWIIEAAHANILAWLTQRPDQPWTLKARVRFFVDNKVMDSNDVMRMFEYTLAPADPQAAGELCEKMLGILTAAALGSKGVTRKRIDVNGNSERALELIQQHESVHAYVPYDRARP